MQWRLFTAGAVLTGLSAAGLVWQDAGSEPAAAEAPGPHRTTTPPTSPATVVPTTTARVSSTSSPTPPSTTTAPPATTTSTQARILPSYPPAVPGLLARAIAGRDIAVCDRLFTAAAAQQLAAGTGTASCPAAIEALAAKVTNATSYSNPSAPQAQPAGDRLVTVDACHLTWTEWGGSGKPPGPQIGRLTLEQQQGSVGYLIASYRAC